MTAQTDSLADVLAALESHPTYGSLYSGDPATLRDLAEFVLNSASGAGLGGTTGEQDEDEDGLTAVEQATALLLWEQWQDPHGHPLVLITEDPRTVARHLRPVLTGDATRPDPAPDDGLLWCGCSAEHDLGGDGCPVHGRADEDPAPDDTTDLRAEVDAPDWPAWKVRAELRRRKVVAGRAWRKVNRLTTERDAALADLAALREGIEAKAREWETLPCAHGYRLPDGQDSESQCLSCASHDLRALLGGTP